MAKKTVAKKINGMGDDAVRAKTGRNWTEWFVVLDKAGAVKMSHKEIAALLGEKHKCPPWWRQMVAVGYEQERGLREKNQKSDGFSASASKTIGVPVETLFAAWTDDKRRARWLPDVTLQIRKATPPKSVRISWGDGKTNVNANFYAKGEAKSQVALEHEKLSNQDEVTRKKAYWAEALERLKVELEG